MSNLSLIPSLYLHTSREILASFPSRFCLQRRQHCLRDKICNKLRGRTASRLQTGAKDAKTCIVLWNEDQVATVVPTVTEFCIDIGNMPGLVLVPVYFPRPTSGVLQMSGV